jgi:hypothetical protein
VKLGIKLGIKLGVMTPARAAQGRNTSIAAVSNASSKIPLLR